ncbi:MAG: ATP-dependent helicase [Acidimicrobiales bacterium]
MFGTWEGDLDDAQRAAATHGDEPLVIVAGAGTGKTRTLTARVAYLLETGTAPERILLLTFTRRAADDMLARAAALTQGKAASSANLTGRLRGGTFHAVAYKVVSAYAEALGLRADFSVIDPADSSSAMEVLIAEAGLFGGASANGHRLGSPPSARSPSPGTLVDIYSRCVNTRQRLSEVVPQSFPWCKPYIEPIAQLFQAYQARKRERSQLDFDDLLLYWLAALQGPRTGPQLRFMFDHVLVDEYQDVNPLQVDIVRELCPDGRGLTVVGDDAQAIYGFRGACAGHLLNLASQLPGARVVSLVRNYRSRQPVLDLANALRPGTAPPGTKGPRLLLQAVRTGGCQPVLVSCYDAASEARALVDRVLERHETGLQLREQAVLVRASHHSDLIELELSARHVPYRKYGGLRFLEAAHVKDFIAAARLVYNPSDDLAWFRLLRLHEGVGPATARSLLRKLPPEAAEAPATAQEALAGTLRQLDAARSAPSTGQQAKAAVELLRPLVSARYTASAARLGDLERLVSSARSAEVAGQSLRDWLASLVFDPPQSSGDFAGPPKLDDDFLVISTVHSAKGLEWPVVHMAHLVDGAFPSDMALGSAEALAEEQRLFYVAVTRARDELFLYAPLRVPHHRFAFDDRHSFAPMSRFLGPDVAPLLGHEEVPPLGRPWLPVAEAGPSGHAAVVPFDLSQLWA